MDPSVSFIIPSCNEIYSVQGMTVLQRTVQDIYDKAVGDFEVIVSFDGPPFQDLPKYPNLRILKFDQRIGLKKNINRLAEAAGGKYLLKLDGHCMVSYAINRILPGNMHDSWIMTPRMYVLDAENWRWQDGRFYDYFYLCCPFTDKRGLRFKAGGHWPERTMENLNIQIDETPQIHGSCWFVERRHFLDRIKGFPEDDPMGHAQEPPYLGLKTWLGPWGGKVVVNKGAWYAHMHKGGQRPRGYSMTRHQENYTYARVAEYWLKNMWSERVHDFEWFVDKFYPMPTWNPDWREVYHKWLKG